MWNYICGAGMLILFTVLYFVLPIWGIRKLYLWFRKKRSIQSPKKYKVILLPIIALNAVPGFIGFLVEEAEMDFNEDILGALMMGIWIITIIHAIIQCRFAGLWIGPLRILLGMAIGISAGAAILIILGILLVLGFVASSDASSQRAAANTRQIYRNGRCYAVHRIGDSEYFTDPKTNETLRIIDDSHVINQNGESFEILDSR